MNEESIQAIQKVDTKLDLLETTINQAKADTKAWQIVAILVPVITTGLLGLFADRLKSDLQHRLEDKTEELKTRLALTQEFYKRKLDVHEKIYKQVVGFADALDVAPRVGGSSAINALTILDEMRKNQAIYLTQKLGNSILTLVRTASKNRWVYKGGVSNGEEVQKSITDVKQQIVDDLHNPEIDRFQQVSKP